MPKYIELSAQTEIALSELFSSNKREENKQDDKKSDKGDEEK